MLLTAAFGLAAVWIWRGVEAGREYVHVDIPTVNSSEMIEVFGVEHRWMPIGGGSGPSSPNVSSGLEERGDAVIFTLSNYLDGPSIYVASRGKGKSLQIPFFLECLAPNETVPVRFSPAFEFSGQVTNLGDRQSLEIRVPRPNIQGRCWINVPYSREAESVHSFFEAGVFEPLDRATFDRRVQYYASEPFFNK